MTPSARTHATMVRHEDGPAAASTALTRDTGEDDSPMHADRTAPGAAPSTSPDATTSTGQLLDIETGPPARAWHAATPPVCPECGVSHDYAKWENRDAVKAVYAERDALRKELAISEGHRELLKAFARAFRATHDTRPGSDLLRWALPIDDLWDAWRDIAFTDLAAAPDGEGGTDG